MDSPSCFGKFWDGAPGSDCVKCRLSDDCLSKFVAVVLPELQAVCPGGPRERWANEVGVSLEGLNLALQHQERQQMGAGGNPPAVSAVATPLGVGLAVGEETMAKKKGKAAPEPAAVAPKKRGRPPKVRPPVEDAPEPVEELPEPRELRLLPETPPAPEKKKRKKKEDTGNFPRAGAARHATAPASALRGFVPSAEGLAGNPRRYQAEGMQRVWSPEFDLQRWTRERARNRWLGMIPLGMRLTAQHEGETYEVLCLRGKYVCRGWWWPTLYVTMKAITGTVAYPKQLRSDGTRPKGVRNLTNWSTTRFFRVVQALGRAKFKNPGSPRVQLARQSADR